MCQNTDHLSLLQVEWHQAHVGIDKGVWLGGLEPLVALQGSFHGGGSAKLGAEAPQAMKGAEKRIGGKEIIQPENPSKSPPKISTQVPNISFSKITTK